MIKIGLSGNRYSGKDFVADAFSKISIPVFNADVVLKFIINHNFETQHNLKTKIGTGIFDNNGQINMQTVRYMGAFDKIVDIAELELIRSYEKFRLKNKHSVYTIFHSSILFERDWDKKMDYNINVHSNLTDRVDRCIRLTGDKFVNISNLMSSEMKDTEKNRKSDYIVYNFMDDIDVFGDIKSHVDKIDQRIINKYLQNEQSFKVDYDSNLYKKY